MLLSADDVTSLHTGKHASSNAATSSPEPTSNGLATTQRVIAGVSQMPPATLDQVVPSIENDDTLDSVPEDLTSTRASARNEILLQPHLDAPLSTPITAIRTHTPAFAAWTKRVLEKKRRKDSASSESSINLPKRRRLFGLREESQPSGSVNNPIRLPLVYNTPFLTPYPIRSPEPEKQRQIYRKREPTPDFHYQGINSLLDCQGCPQSFAAQAQILIEKQQNSYRTSRISRHPFDQSFEKSMFNDGRGKLGERAFSSTGANIREIVEQPVRGVTAANLPEKVSVEVVTEVAEYVRAQLKSSECVLGSYRLLEIILLQCEEVSARATILNARAVNKTFAQVIRRSSKLQRILRGR